MLRNAAAAWYKKWYNVDLNADTEILPLIGSKEGIMHICMTYLNEGDLLYSFLTRAILHTGALPPLPEAKCLEYNLSKEHNWFPDFKDMENSLHMNRVKLMFVNYPQMPTGKLPAKELFDRTGWSSQKNITF